VDVVAEHPEHTGLQIEAPVPESITVLSRDRTEKRMGNGRMRTTFRYDLTAFVPGAYTALVGRASLSGGEGVSAVTTDLAGIVFHVESILAASGRDPLTEVWRDLPGLARGPRSRLPRLLWALPLVALIALGAGLFARRRGRTQAAEPVPPAAHEVALRELEKLRAEQWVERGEGETFIVRLSGIVRRYLEGRFDLRAPECTTEEFIRDAAQSSLLSSMHQQLTRSFLEQSDLVKFARWRPEAGTLQETFAAAERLVRETVPVSTGPEPAGEDGA
jgi:hypothetical protein